MQEFVPFDDCWLDCEPPARLVPLPRSCECVRDADGVFHWVRADSPEIAITLPWRAPIRAAVPALSSST